MTWYALLRLYLAKCVEPIIKSLLLNKAPEGFFKVLFSSDFESNYCKSGFTKPYPQFTLLITYGAKVI